MRRYIGNGILDDNGPYYLVSETEAKLSTLRKQLKDLQVTADMRAAAADHWKGEMAALKQEYSGLDAINRNCNREIENLKAERDAAVAAKERAEHVIAVARKISDRAGGVPGFMNELTDAIYEFDSYASMLPAHPDHTGDSTEMVSTYQHCSVIQDDEAYYILGLVRKDAQAVHPGDATAGSERERRLVSLLKEAVMHVGNLSLNRSASKWVEDVQAALAEAQGVKTDTPPNLVPVYPGPDLKRGDIVYTPSGRRAEVYNIDEDKGTFTSQGQFCASVLRREALEPAPWGGPEGEE